MENLSILVTGGAGFIGSHIVEYLLNNNIKFIRILDNLSTGKKSNIEILLKKYSNLEFMYGDMANLEICRKAVKDIDLICHQASIGSILGSVEDLLSSHISNVNGFLNILISAKEKGIKRIVYASSSYVYGDNEKILKVEENTGNVLSPYAATKAINEIYANVFTKCYGMECIGLRYFNIFGPRQDPNSQYSAVILKSILLMKQGKQPIINGDGTFLWDFTYVENAVNANILALTTNNKKCFGEVFNIGCGEQYCLNKLIEILNKNLEITIKPIYEQYEQVILDDILHSNADISKAINLLNYKPLVSFEEGINKLIGYENKNDNVHNICIDKINFSELLNREEINLDNINDLEYLTNKTIMVTGGYGSIGSEIVRQLIKFSVKKIIIYDNNECNFFYLKEELKNNNIIYILGDINDNNKIEDVFINNIIDIVYHVAAYKHVPILEDNEYESIKVNINGTKIVADLSLKYNIKKFIFVSTDKAVNPTNVMGCCKRISEIYCNYLWNQYHRTEFITTRFGNVLGSSGSVIPSFIKNINNNQDLFITHKDITRYFMTIPEAAKLVILSSCIGKENNKLLFDMGEPVKIIDLANNLLNQFNIKNIKIKISNLRPGEKMYEELFYNKENLLKTNYNKILLLQSEQINFEEFIKNYNEILKIKFNENSKIIRNMLKKIVNEYNF